MSTFVLIHRLSFVVPSSISKLNDGNNIRLYGSWDNFEVGILVHGNEKIANVGNIDNGIYQYKWNVNGKWMLDPDGIIVNNDGWNANNVISIDTNNNRRQDKRSLFYKGHFICYDRTMFICLKNTIDIVPQEHQKCERKPKNCIIQ